MTKLLAGFREIQVLERDPLYPELLSQRAAEAPVAGLVKSLGADLGPQYRMLAVLVSFRPRFFRMYPRALQQRRGRTQARTTIAIEEGQQAILLE